MSTPTSDTRTASRTARPARPAWQIRLGAVAVATVVNALIGALAPLLGVSLLIAPPGQPEGPVPFMAFAVFTLVFGLLGWAALALAERLLGAGRGRLVWTVVAVVFTAVSCVPSLSVGGDAATEAVLVATHVVAAAVLVPAFWTSSRVS